MNEADLSLKEEADLRLNLDDILNLDLFYLNTIRTSLLTI